jgi:hypothetical protein
MIIKMPKNFKITNIRTFFEKNKYNNDLFDLSNVAGQDHFDTDPDPNFHFDFAKWASLALNLSSKGGHFDSSN